MGGFILFFYRTYLSFLNCVTPDLFQRLAIRKAAFTAETLQIYQAALEKRGVLSAVINYHRQLLSPQAWLRHLSRPRPVTVPTLVLWAEEDAVFSPKLIEGMEQLVQARFRLKLVPHCGHWIQQEAPRIVNRELLNFLCTPKSNRVVSGLTGA